LNIYLTTYVELAYTEFNYKLIAPSIYA